MCCYKEKKTEREVMARFGKRKTAVFWKELHRDGRSECAQYQYKPGVNIADGVKGRYRNNRPRGLHVFLEKPKRSWSLARVSVTCHRDDFICAGDNQAVFRKLTIRKKDWAKAGLRQKGK